MHPRRVYVNEGTNKTLQREDGVLVVSTGFISCTALLLVNIDAQQLCFMHIFLNVPTFSDARENSKPSQQAFTEFSAVPGKKKAYFIYGVDSHDRKPLETICANAGYDVTRYDYKFDSKKSFLWNVEFDCATGEISCYQERLYNFNYVKCNVTKFDISSEIKPPVQMNTNPLIVSEMSMFSRTRFQASETNFSTGIQIQP